MSLYAFFIFLILLNVYNLKLASVFLIVYNLSALILNKGKNDFYNIVLSIITILFAIMIFYFDNILFYQHKFTISLLFLALMVRYSDSFIVKLLSDLNLPVKNRLLFRKRLSRVIFFFVILNEIIISFYTFEIWAAYKLIAIITISVSFYLNYTLLKK